MPLTGLRRTEALAGGIPPRNARRLSLSVTVSLLVHIALFLLLFLTIARKKPHEEMLPPPADVTMLFQTGSKAGPSMPHPSQQATPVPPRPAARPTPPLQAPLRMPTPQPTPTPQPIPKPVPQTAAHPASQPVAKPAPPVPQPPSVPEAEQHTPSETPPVPSQRQLAKPAAPVSIQPPAVVQPRQLPILPPPVPPPAPRAATRPPIHAAPANPRAHPAVRKPAKPGGVTLPAPMDLTFGGSASLAQPHPPARTPAHIPARRPGMPGIIDMSLGPAAKGSADLTPQSDNDIKAQGADWRNALSRWVSEHAYYPDQAVQLGEEGDSSVRVTVMPDGRVKEVELVGRSGSMWLDMGLVSMFRDAHIPPLPPGRDKPFTFQFTMHYVLLPPH